MKSILSACLISFGMLVQNAAGAEDMRMLSGDLVTVQYPGTLRNVAQEVIRLYPQLRKELEELFGASMTFTPTVVLIADRRDFQRLAGTLPVAALALSDSDRIIIDNSRMKTYPFTLAVTLKHELCHLFLHHLTRGGDLPRWLNEGIAQWTSDGIAELIVGENGNILRQAVLSKQLIPLAALDSGFPQDEHSLVLAYEQSRSVIGFLDAAYGPQTVVRTLKHIQEGCDVDCALRAGAGLTLPELEQRWHASLQGSAAWFPYISDYLYQFLFAFAAILLTAGFIRMLLRKRSYKDPEDPRDPDSQPPP